MRQRAAHPFSMAWKKYFHTVEKSVQSCSIVWKNRQNFFHCVEKSPKLFPLRGKISPHFSTLWKKDFHTVEKCEARP